MNVNYNSIRKQFMLQDLIVAVWKTNIKMIYIWNALWLDCIYILYTWVECIITEYWRCHTIQTHTYTRTNARIKRDTHKFIDILFFIAWVAYNTFHPLTQSIYIYVHSNLLHEQLQSAHTSHLSTARNHRQLIMWKMYEKKMRKLALASIQNARSHMPSTKMVYIK